MTAFSSAPGRADDLTCALVAEIGSTVTKVHAFAGLSTSAPAWLGRGAAPTTVAEGDVTLGLRAALADLERSTALEVTGWPMLAASSAAGGLRMSVHGLVPDMTVRAAREAALGAGAIPVLVTTGEMGPSEVARLREAAPGVVLLAGGVEGGERSVIVKNAKAIAGSGLKAPVVYAGNSAARGEAVAVLQRGGLKVRVVPNVYPRVDHLDLEPARRAIQDVFEEHIVTAPGLERVRDVVVGVIRPTPGAVLEAAEVLRPVIGDLVVLDVGGATTDVHSVTPGAAGIQRLQLHPEPLAKRTVEGDLGVYVNAANVVGLAGGEEVAAYMSQVAPELGRDAAPFDAAAVRRILARLRPLPPEAVDAEAQALVEALARIAAEIALVRHAGRLRQFFGPTGRVTLAEGKDLTEVECLVGTGGPLARFPNALRTLSRLVALAPGIVEARLRRIEEGGESPAAGVGPAGQCLLPGRRVRVVVDRHYLLAVLGVLHHECPKAAVSLLGYHFGGCRPNGSQSSSRAQDGNRPGQAQA